MPGLPSTFGYAGAGAAPTGWSHAGDVLSMNAARRPRIGLATVATTSRTGMGGQVACINNSGFNTKFTCYFVIGDAARSGAVTLYPDRVELWTNGGGTLAGSYTVDMTTTHTVRLVKEGATYEVWVDATLQITGTSTSGADNLSYFGQGTAAPHGVMDISAMRWTTVTSFRPGRRTGRHQCRHDRSPDHSHR